MDLTNLTSFLQTYFPDDVLMPVKKGTKYPMFPYKNKMWTWDKFLSFDDIDNTDVCMVLHDVCVVDVDNMSLVYELEKQFPILTTVPTEKTKRGHHYFFIRPPEADKEGYYDGANQRIKGIDFKSICQTGTGGIVIVAPSTDKTWVRPPWKCEMIHMPMDLLNTIADPKHKSVNVFLQFNNGSCFFVESCKWLNNMSYFDPLFDDDGYSYVDIESAFPVPCSYSKFTKLLDTLDSNSLSEEYPTRDFYLGLIETADILGLAPRLLARLIRGVPRFQLDMAEMCPEWWSSLYKEKMWRIHGACDNSILLDIPRVIKFEPMQKGEGWLFPFMIHAHNDAPGKNVMNVEWNSTYTVVASLLHAYPGKVVLAGGMALSVVSNTTKGSDYDLFIVSPDPNEATRIVNDIRDTFFKDCSRVIITCNAITIVLPNGEIVQVVLRLYKNVAQILVGFDLPPCKVAIYDDGSYNLVAKCTPSWIASMRHKAFPLDISQWGLASPIRVMKYIAKGFDVFVPGLRRMAMINQPMQSMSKVGLSALFWCERYVTIYSRRRVTTDIIKVISRRIKYESDYTTLHKLYGTLAYIVRAFVKFGKTMLWKGSLRRENAEVNTYDWHVCDPTRETMGMFNPIDPMISKVFCKETLASLLDIRK